MLGDMFLWLVANLKQGVIYFIKQALPPNISAGSVCTRVPKCQKSWEGISLLTYVVCIHNLHPKAVKQLFYLWNFSMNFNEKQKLCTVYGGGGSKRPAAGCTLPFAHYLLMIIVFRAMNRLDTFFFLCCSSHPGWPVVRRIEMSSFAQ